MDSSGMIPLYTAQQTRELDRCAIEEHGIPGIRLMRRAAEAVFRALLERWPEPDRLQVLCGTGNNGGDGFLVAWLARRHGIPATVLQLGAAGKICGDALRAREQALADGVPVEAFRAEAVADGGIIVDAMLGTGLGGEVRGVYREAVAAVNASGLPVVAIDIPSGLCADTGRELGESVRAALTVTFIARKRGFYTLAGPDLAGELVFDDLGVPASVYAQCPATCFAPTLSQALSSLAPRPAAAHKGLYGTVLVVGGDHGMAGAALLAAEAALRSGAGLVRAATRPEHVAAMVGRRPEIMAVGVDSGPQLAPWVDGADVLVVGPGLGRSSWSEQLLQVAADSGKPLVLDADGLNLLAGGTPVAVQPVGNRVLTPHPGEAGRLLGSTSAAVQEDRFAAVRELQRRYGGVVLLKGNGTLIAGEKQCWLSTSGNPGMASGGMGDVLSGVIGALLAQGLPSMEAAALGACVHGAAADRAMVAGQRGLIATDLLPELRALLA